MFFQNLKDAEENVLLIKEILGFYAIGKEENKYKKIVDSLNLYKDVEKLQYENQLSMRDDIILECSNLVDIGANEIKEANNEIKKLSRKLKVQRSINRLRTVIEGAAVVAILYLTL